MGQSLGADLCTAVINNDLPSIKQLLQDGASPHFMNEYHRTSPLMLAAEAGKLEIVELLLESRPSTSRVDLPNLNGYTALMLALQYRHLEVARLLLKYPHDLSQQ